MGKGGGEGGGVVLGRGGCAGRGKHDEPKMLHGLEALMITASMQEVRSS